MNALLPASIAGALIITMIVVAALVKGEPPPAVRCTAELHQGNATYVATGTVRRDARGAIVCEVRR